MTEASVSCLLYNFQFHSTVQLLARLRSIAVFRLTLAIVGRFDSARLDSILLQVFAHSSRAVSRYLDVVLLCSVVVCVALYFDSCCRVLL